MTMNSFRSFVFAFLATAILPVVVSTADLRIVDAVKARDKGTVQSLIKQRMDVNATQPDGATALHWAAHWDYLDTADLLIRAGAKVNAVNQYGVTPLSLACSNANAAMVEKLLDAGADPNIALPSGETILMTCSRTGNVAAVRALLVKGVNVNAKESEQGQTALMWAVAQKHPDVVKSLVEHGADIHLFSTGGFSALFFAARNGDVESARMLLATGADVNEVLKTKNDANGMTPLLLASASGHVPLATFLLEHGANPNATDAYGATALHYTELRGLTVLNGVAYANYQAYLFRPNMTELVRVLLDHGANPNAQLMKAPPAGGYGGKSVIGATPFLLAAATGDASIMKQLAAHGANPTLGTAGKLTPLIVAAGVGRGQDFTDEETKSAFEAVKVAVELGNDVNAAEEGGLTAMHGASLNGANDIVQYLADKGAKLDVRDQYQQTPLSIATGIRLPWIPKGDELGEVVRKTTADLLLKLGATPVDTPNYFTPMATDTIEYKMNQSQRYEGLPPAK